MLGLAMLRQTVAIAVVWFFKPLSVDAPGKFGALVLFPLLVVALWASLRPRPVGEPAPAPATAA